MSREKTAEEIEKELIEGIWDSIWFWDTQVEGNAAHKLSGLAHSILALLDGCSDLPAFLLVPVPHPDDKEYNIQEGNDYYPQNLDAEENVVCLEGALHEMLYKYKPSYISDGRDSLTTE